MTKQFFFGSTTLAGGPKLLKPNISSTIHPGIRQTTLNKIKTGRLKKWAKKSLINKNQKF